MDSSKALDCYAERRDLLNGFLFEYALLADENPELTELLTFDAYVQFCFSYFSLAEQRTLSEPLRQELRRLREHMPLPVPTVLRGP